MSISTIVLPTCNPGKMNEYIIPSLKELSKLKDICNIAIMFQPPYIQEQIEEIIAKIKNAGLKLKYDYKDFRNGKGHCEGLLKIRQKTSELFPKSDYYIIIDDDMEFLEGIDIQYRELINVMENDTNIGVCLLKRENADDHNLYYADIVKTRFWTDATQIFRGGKYYGFKGIYPEELHNLKGRGEDNVRCVWHVSLGESVLIRYDSKVIHYQTSNISNQYNEANYDMVENSLRNWLRKFNPMFLKGGKQSGWNFNMPNARICFSKGTKEKGIYNKGK